MSGASAIISGVSKIEISSIYCDSGVALFIVSGTERDAANEDDPKVQTVTPDVYGR
jgi:hypothetical protein